MTTVQAAAGPLAGTGRIADDLYLMAHDENTGRPLIGPRLLGTGLAAALLAELMLTGGLVLHYGSVGGVTVDSGMVMACRAEIADDLASACPPGGGCRAAAASGAGMAGVPGRRRRAERGVPARAGRLPGAGAPQAAVEGCSVGPGRPGLGVRAAVPCMPRSGPGPQVRSRPRRPAGPCGGVRARVPHDRAPARPDAASRTPPGGSTCRCRT